jgi:site-specific DNA recombinase
MIALARRKPPPFTVLLVHKLDRFSRNREDAVTYKALLRRQGIRLISLSEPLGDGPIDRLLEGILEVVAEFYSLNLGQEVKKGLRETARRGYFTGGKAPYGYRLRGVEGPDGKKKNLFEVDPEKAPVVKRIYEDYGDRGSTFSFIVDSLNAEGVPSPTGRKWGRNEIYGILTNEVYRGARVWNKRTFTHGSGYTRKKTNPVGEWIVTENAHEAIVTPELWSRVQAQMKARGLQGNNGRSARSVYLLSGLARCSECGGPISGKSVKAKGIAYRFYSCGRGYNTMTCTKTARIRAEELEKFLIHQIREILLSPESLDKRVQAAIEKHAKEKDQGHKKQTANQKELARVEGQISRLLDMAADTGHTAAMVNKLQALEKRKADLLKESEKDEGIARVLTFDDIREVLKISAAHLDSANPEEVKLWLQALITDFQLDIKGKRATYSLRLPVSVSQSLCLAMVAGESNGHKAQTRKHTFRGEIVQAERIYA